MVLCTTGLILTSKPRDHPHRHPFGGVVMEKKVKGKDADSVCYFIKKQEEPFADIGTSYIGYTRTVFTEIECPNGLFVRMISPSCHTDEEVNRWVSLVSDEIAKFPGAVNMITTFTKTKKPTPPIHN